MDNSFYLPQWHISGYVVLVDNMQQTITLYLEGFYELQTIKVDASLPDWLLKADIAFNVKLPRICVRTQSLELVQWLDWEYVGDLALMDEEELIQEMVDLFSKEENTDDHIPR